MCGWWVHGKARPARRRWATMYVCILLDLKAFLSITDSTLPFTGHGMHVLIQTEGLWNACCCTPRGQFWAMECMAASYHYIYISPPCIVSVIIMYKIRRCIVECQSCTCCKWPYILSVLLYLAQWILANIVAARSQVIIIIVIIIKRLPPC